MQIVHVGENIDIKNKKKNQVTGPSKKTKKEGPVTSINQDTYRLIKKTVYIKGKEIILIYFLKSYEND